MNSSKYWDKLASPQRKSECIQRLVATIHATHPKKSLFANRKIKCGCVQYIVLTPENIKYIYGITFCYTHRSPTHRSHTSLTHTSLTRTPCSKFFVK